MADVSVNRQRLADTLKEIALRVERGDNITEVFDTLVDTLDIVTDIEFAEKPCHAEEPHASV